MSTTAKKTTKKKTALAGAVKTEKKVNYVIDPETGKKISRAGLAMRKYSKKPMLEIVDMRAVLR
ncbi:hypothetical protein [Capnocytophaga catalasegens]|uniref:Uncharacterized protein n=1 Tax=Capnocytophaga catalasegens TaxID=1004260 RepID=A0AAV5B0L9_9FLAO|nr:hypothetical protein [Capnocytophaga catalasegens]GIZ16637.1 hypothetical protein RCZ03_26370 [Capnocytophaga catalasegens]GJM51662.1 hypothetical protein RCZ15_26350 [Capnocytophaga catalasegens]GJM54011.1 hypothetical protein RCZ16_23270 [Capnocytophaga catalasegens]